MCRRDFPRPTQPLALRFAANKRPPSSCPGPFIAKVEKRFSSAPIGVSYHSIMSANVPGDLRYAKSHEWVRVNGDTAAVGISDHAQHELTDVVFVELPA